MKEKRRRKEGEMSAETRRGGEEKRQKIKMSKKKDTG